MYVLHRYKYVAHLWLRAQLVGWAEKIDDRSVVQIPASTVHTLEASLDRTLNSKLLLMGLAAPCIAAAPHWRTSVRVNGCMTGHCKALCATVKALESVSAVHLHICIQTFNKGTYRQHFKR